MRQTQLALRKFSSGPYDEGNGRREEETFRKQV